MVNINTATEFGHKHGEAFMIMLYSCKKCKHEEKIWNSRDGVTPFGCTCPGCGRTMVHIRWELDVYAPKHSLQHNQRFWRDGTPLEAEAIIRRRIMQAEGTENALPPDVAERLIEQVGKGTLPEFQPGWPMLDGGKKLVETGKK